MVKVVGQDNKVSVVGYEGKALVDPAIVFEGKNGLDGKDGKDGVPGPEGMPGRDGVNGVDGKDGKDGRDGIDGKDGISFWIEYDKKTNTLIFKNNGGKKSPDPVKLEPLVKGWGYGAGRGGGQVQADWNQTDKNNPTFIKNKPAVHNIRFLVVEELPTVGDPWTIYMIQEGENQRGGSGGNIYSEWVFVENEITHTLSWEKFGTDVDLSGYVKYTDIVSSVDASSTNEQAVGAKLFYDTCGDIETLINAL